MKQIEAIRLLKLDKFEIDPKVYPYPQTQDSVRIPLISHDKKEIFSLDITCGLTNEVNELKITYNHRVKNTIILARIDLVPDRYVHKNPDDTIIHGSHFHIYREEFDDKWAYKLPTRFLQYKDRYYDLLNEVMDFLKINPKIQFQSRWF